MRENILRYFGYMMRRKEEEAVKVVIKMNVEGKREETKKEIIGYN